MNQRFKSNVLIELSSMNEPQKKYRLGMVSKIILLEALKPVSRHANLTLSSDVDQDTFGKVT